MKTRRPTSHKPKKQNSLTKPQSRSKAIERNQGLVKALYGCSEDLLMRLKICSDGWSSEYASVNALLRHLARKTKSESSRSHYCWPIYKLCNNMGMNPDELCKMPKELVEKAVQDFVDKKVQEGCSRSYGNNLLSWSETFFRVNGFVESNRLKLQKYHVATRSRAKPEYIPTAEEAFKMASTAGSLRDRAIILTLTSSGLRNSTLRAVRYGVGSPDPMFSKYIIKDELQRNEKNLAIFVYPEMKQLVPDACKNRIPYYTFTSYEATEAIRDYLRERIEKHGAIGDHEPLFCSGYNQLPQEQRRELAVCGRHLSMIVKKAAKKSGLKYWKQVHAHSLRKTFESIMRNQPGESRLDIKDQEFLMGHMLPGSQENYYDMSRVEEMREKYSRMFFFNPSRTSTKKVIQKIISEEELERYLAEGWLFVPGSRLSSGKIIVSRNE